MFDKYRKRGAGYHWEQISKSITKSNIFVKARYNIVLNQLETRDKKQILDVGCGDGALSYLLAGKTGAFVIGIDSSDEAINFAKKKTENAKNVDFMKASAYYLPFKRDSFDYVISLDVIEHLRKPEKMLAEIKRVFNGQGKVIITTPLRFTEKPIDSMHIQEFFESDLKKLIGKFFDTEVSIIKSHPLVFMELQNRHFLVKYLFNLLNLLFRFNPFENSKHWRYYAMQTLVIEGKTHGSVLRQRE